MAILVGSARQDERGKLTNGQAGDQNGKEVSTQNMYSHSKGWYIVRPKSEIHANKIAERMLTACENNNIGYDQNQRLGVIQNGIDTKMKTEADCSSLVRACVKEATGKDPGNFNTSNEVSCLQKTGLFEKEISYISQSKTPVYNGDILVTKTKGHTVIVVSGSPRNKAQNTTEVSPNGNPYEKPTVLICTKDIAVKRGYSSRQYSAKGNGVRWLQYALNSKGYKGANGKSLVVDGECGSNTEYAIKLFQKDNSLTVDGIAGSKTTSLLS